ncbi:MAG: BON domain-containing protein [Acidobacteriota bacterium]
MRNIHRKLSLLFCQLVLVAVLSPGGVIRAGNHESGSFSMSDSSVAVLATADAAAKTDTEIQQCIAERLAASPALKDQGLTASVSNGVAILTGVARNPGSKGNATRIAKKCGATTVTNNISISPAFKQKKPGTDKMQ